MKVAYIAGPYRGESPSKIVKNIRNAESVAIKYWRKGYAVICPHKNTSLFDGLADDDVWMDGGLELLSRCDIIVMVQGWSDSEGSIAELRYAKKIGLDIIYE